MKISVKSNIIIVFIFLNLFICNCETSKESSCPYSGEVNLIFERGFDNSFIQVVINDEIYYKGFISTDKSIEVAKYFVLDGDTINSMSVIYNEEIIGFCPNHITTIDYLNNKLIIEDLKEFPTYE